MVNAKEATETVIKRVEDVTNTPVLVRPDASLPLIATMQMARGGAPLHLISYNPRLTSAEYAVAFQCGFILRLYELPQDRRFDVASTTQGRKAVDEMVAALKVPNEMRDKYSALIYDGLIRQLRSMPAGLRVDAWLTTEFPVLADQQREFTVRQLKDNLSTLAPEIKSMAPPKVYSANVSMNATYASFWSRRWSEPEHVSPYKVTGYLDQGERLLEIWDEISSAPSGDRCLIEAFGEEIGISGWFEFVPFK